jgi:broad specificity phosphatase PhoE
LSPGNNDLWAEYQTLKVKLLRRGSVDARLRKWSQGLIEGQTFQQMTNEFADLIVPKVWEREGRKVSRVATKLSISPKKVRRILTRLGLKGD